MALREMTDHLTNTHSFESPCGPMMTSNHAADLPPLKHHPTHTIPINKRPRTVSNDCYPEDPEADEDARDTPEKKFYNAATWRMYHRIVDARRRHAMVSSPLLQRQQDAEAWGENAVPRFGHTSLLEFTSRSMPAIYPDHCQYDHFPSSSATSLCTGELMNKVPWIDPSHTEAEAMLCAPFPMDE